MESWSDGMTKDMTKGRMEHWNVGILEKNKNQVHYSITPALHYSNSSTLQYSITPFSFTSGFLICNHSQDGR